jgi:hypothetical protein
LLEHENIWSIVFIAFSHIQLSIEAGGGCRCALNPDKRSRATVKLNSTDVRDPPSVDTNMLAQQEEVDRMVLCIERERLYWEELRELGFTITETVPGEGVDLQAAVSLSCLFGHLRLQINYQTCRGSQTQQEYLLVHDY